MKDIPSGHEAGSITFAFTGVAAARILCPTNVAPITLDTPIIGMAEKYVGWVSRRIRLNTPFTQH